jgi:cellulose synthase/poly-beta-1,6-N-acetylglucosamine synthase-like glycosyltransferase
MMSRSLTTENVFKSWDYLIFVFLSLLSLFAVFLFLWHWFSVADWRVRPITSSLATTILVTVLLNNQGRWYLLPFMKKPRPMTARSGYKVAVVTTVVPSAEPMDMLYETVKAIVNLDYPHDTWVLDEEDDAEVRALCLKLGARHFSRKGLPKYQAREGIFQSNSKHGNYNAWLHHVGFDCYDFVTTFDPDHTPNSTFLNHVLGYFEDERVAYVQAAQAYYNQEASFIAQGAAEETYAYYSSVQMAAYGMGYPIIVGCHTTHRMAALRELGGFAPHDAEDLLLTLIYRKNGWEGVYIPQILARGVTPVDWDGYLRQQRRWARSVLDIKLRRFAEFSKMLSLKSCIMSFLHGLNYLHRAILIALSFLLLAYMLATGRTPAVVSYVTLQKIVILCGVMQLCEFYRQRFYLDPRSEWGFHWRVALLQYAKWPWFLLAFLDVLLNRQKPYVLTPKIKPNSREHPLLRSNLFIMVLLLGAWSIGLTLNHDAHPIVYGCTTVILITSVALMWTDFWRFPAPYTKELMRTALLKKHRSRADTAPELVHKQACALRKHD